MFGLPTHSHKNMECCPLVSESIGLRNANAQKEHCPQPQAGVVRMRGRKGEEGEENILTGFSFYLTMSTSYNKKNKK